MREVCFLIGEGDVVLWSDASNSPVALPDSRARWEAIWSRREAIVEIAHSHPMGPLAFSHEDETTMDALVSALGRSMTFSVVAPSGMVRVTKEKGPREGGEEPPASPVQHGSLEREEPWWAALLRLASGMPRAETARKTPQEE
jgi:hypothetical protein